MFDIEVSRYSSDEYFLDTCVVKHEFILNEITGEIVCMNCGLIESTHEITNQISYTENTNNFNILKLSSNFCNNPNLKRALKLNKNKTWTDRKIDIGFTEIKRLISVFNINNAILDRSKYLFQKAIVQDVFRGLNIRLISQVCFYYSCKSARVILSLENIIENEPYTSKLAYRYYYLILKTLKLERPTINPLDQVVLYCDQLNLNEEIVQKTQSILRKFLQSSNISGLSLSGIVAGAIYLVCCKEKILCSQRKIAKVAKISDITLRSRLKELKIKRISALI